MGELRKSKFIKKIQQYKNSRQIVNLCNCHFRLRIRQDFHVHHLLKCIPGGCAFGPLSKGLRIYIFFNFSFIIDGLKGKSSGSQGFLGKLGKLDSRRRQAQGRPCSPKALSGPEQQAPPPAGPHAQPTPPLLPTPTASQRCGQAGAAPAPGRTAGCRCARWPTEGAGRAREAGRPRGTHAAVSLRTGDPPAPRVTRPAVASTFSPCLTPICALPALAS